MIKEKPFDYISATEHQRLYQDLVETSQDLIWQCDAEGRYIYLNPAWESTFGYKVEEMLGKKFSDFQTPEYAKKDMEEFLRLMQGGTVKGYETIHTGKFGNKIHLVFSAKYVRNDDGIIVGIRGTAHDITARKRAEEELRASEALNRSIIASSPMGMHQYELTQDNRLIFVGANPAADKILGVDNSVFIGKTIEVAFPPLAATEVPSRYRDVVKTGVIWQTEQVDYSDNRIKGAFHVVAFRTGANTMVAMFLDITARKQAEEALKVSEDKFVKAFRLSPDLLMITALIDGRIVEVNDKTVTMLGYAREEIVGKTTVELQMWVEPLQRTQFISRLMHDGYVRDYDVRLRLKSGKVIDSQISGEMIDLQDGKFILSTMRDITERKLAEKKLRESEVNLKKAQEIAKLGSWDWKLTGNIVWSEELYRIYGVSPETLPNVESFLNIIHPDERLVMQEWIRACSEGEMPGELEFRVIHPDGSIHWICGRGELMFDSDGKPAYMTGTAQDITERKQAEEALKSAKEYAEMLIRTANAMVIGMDNQGNVTLFNHAAEEITGYTQEELMGRGWFDVVVPKDKYPFVWDEYVRLSSGGIPVDFENPIVTKKGEVRYVIWRNSPIINNNCLMGILSFGIDITERKTVTDKLAERNRFIESLVDLSPNILYIYDLIERKNVYANEGLEKVLGYTIEELQEMGEQTLPRLMHPDDFKQYLEHTVPQYQTLHNGEQLRTLYRVKHYNGEWRWLQSNETIYLRNKDGSPRQIFGVASDFSEVILAQDSLRRLNRNLRALSSCNQALVRTDNEMSLLQEICRIICQDAGYPMAWVGFLAHGQNGFVRRIATWGTDTQDLRDLNLDFFMQDFWQGPAQAAIQGKQTYIINDFMHPSVNHSWRDYAEMLGYHSAIVLPLLDNQKTVFGTLSIYSCETEIFTLTEVRLLEELAGDLSFGIGNLRLRIEQTKVEKNLEASIKEKEAILHELYHRTKNNMQVISAFLEMQAMHSKKKHEQIVFHEVQNRISAMALVHEKLYQSKSLSVINLEEYLAELAALVLKSYSSLSGRVVLQIKTEPIRVTIDIAIPCGLVVTELLINSFKYAFASHQSGTIELLLCRHGTNEAMLVVRDNGAGKGTNFDIKQLHTLGIPIAVSIVERQLHGSIELDTSDGFCWQIRFRTDLYRERV